MWPGLSELLPQLGRKIQRELLLPFRVLAHTIRLPNERSLYCQRARFQIDFLPAKRLDFTDPKSREDLNPDGQLEELPLHRREQAFNLLNILQVRGFHGLDIGTQLLEYGIEGQVLVVLDGVPEHLPKHPVDVPAGLR